MEIINKKQKAKVSLKRTGPKANRELYDLLLSMKVGDSAIIDKEDWKGKDKFGHVIHSSASLRGKFSCAALKDNSGWLVERV